MIRRDLRTQTDRDQDTLAAIYLLTRTHLALGPFEPLQAYQALSHAVQHLQKALYPKRSYYPPDPQTQEDRLMTRDKACEVAQLKSLNGYVQHVNLVGEDDCGVYYPNYIVSDWYDSDTTVVSYENGKELSKRS